MSDTLDKKYLLEVLDKLAEGYDSKHCRVASLVKGLIINIERGMFDTEEPAE